MVACDSARALSSVSPRRSTLRARGVYSPPVWVVRSGPQRSLAVWSTIEDKVRRGERLSTAEGVYLLAEAPLLELGSLANEVRARKTDPNVVTYVIDTNPNYTNVCTVDCHFCAFYRKPSYSGPDVYTHDVEGVMQMMERAHRLG